MKRMFAVLAVFLSIFFFPAATQASSGIEVVPYQSRPVRMGERVVWIDPHGSDIFGDGTIAHPLLTPAYAARRVGPGGIVLVDDGVYSVFGSLDVSGTAESPITIRPAPEAHPVFSLIDANDGIQLAASHLVIEGLTVTHEQLAHPGACISVHKDVSDISLVGLSIHTCDRGFNVGRWAFSWGKMSDLSFTGLTGPAIDCGAGACVQQEWQRVAIARGDTGTTSTAMVRLGERSAHVLLSGFSFHDVFGAGIESNTGSIGIENSVFEAIEGTMISLRRGGTVSYSLLHASSTGIQAFLRGSTVFRGNLLLAANPKANPLEILGVDGQSASVLLEKNRIQVTRTPFVLLPMQEKAHLSFWRNGFFFPSEDARVSLFGKELSLEEFAHTSTTQVENGGDQMIGSGEIGAESLFSPLIEGGRVDVGDPNSLEDTRIIYAGTFLKAKKPEVYFFGQDSRLHFVPRSDVLRSWIAAGANIEEVPQATIDQIDHGEDLPYRPRTVLIRTSESSAVYAVTGQQQVQWIPTESLAEETYGPTWRRLIRVLTSQEFSQYRLEAPLFSATEIPALDTRAEWVDPSDAF
jgi:hypothetical protein